MDAAAVPKGEVVGAPPNEKPPEAAAGAAAGVSVFAAAVFFSAGFSFSSFAAGAANENFAGAGADPPKPNEGVAGAAANEALEFEDSVVVPNEPNPPAGGGLAGAAPKGDVVDVAGAAGVGAGAGAAPPPAAFSRSSFSASCALAYPALAFARNAAPNPAVVGAAGFGGSAASVSSFNAGDGNAANASGAATAGASSAASSSAASASASSTLAFCFFAVLVTLGPEIRESTALTTALSSTGSRSLGAARRLLPTGDANERPSSEPASELADEKGVRNAETAEPGVPGVPGVVPFGVPGDSPPPPGVWNAGMRRTGEKDASDVPGDDPDTDGDGRPERKEASEASFSSRAASSSSRAVCESITARRRRSSRSVSSRAVPSMPVGGLDAEPGSLLWCPVFVRASVALALASVPRTPPRATPNARSGGGPRVPGNPEGAPAADLSSDAGRALAAERKPARRE